MPDVGDMIHAGVEAGENHKKTSKGLLFFYGIGNWMDRFLMRGLDTNYIALPEHSWKIAYTNAMVGVHSTVHSTTEYEKNLKVTSTLVNKTTPSVDLGFYAGYRGFGFGYSWDALNAYTRRLNFSFGSKFIGLDFSLQTSGNITTNLMVEDMTFDTRKNLVTITNASLNLWYALNAAHYSHQAAIKQSYIQKKSAGSLLLHLQYMSSQVELSDTLKYIGGTSPILPSLMSGMTAIRTRQIAVGIGYGINYTPNKGKVILHASAAAMLVAYSVNLISYYLPDSILAELPDKPMYYLNPSFPVHVTGNMRAAVSWEINKYVHLNAWATVENIRFNSAYTANDSRLRLSNWNWKVQASVGVRFGAGKDRLQRALEERNEVQNERVDEPKKSRIPEWITGYFWSPKY